MEEIRPVPNFEIELEKLKEEQARLEALEREKEALAVTYTPPVVQMIPSGSIGAQAQSILAARGLSNEWAATDFIINHESGWNLYAVNPSSGACGLVQALPCSKIVWGDANMQINWFIDYCYSRYGSIWGAYNFWQAHNWY